MLRLVTQMFGVAKNHVVHHHIMDPSVPQQRSVLEALNEEGLMWHIDMMRDANLRMERGVI